MSMKTTLLSAAVLATLLFLGCGPLVMVPGGRLSGEVAPVPQDWAFTDSVDTVQLETRPSDPYSVNVWGVSAMGAFYVSAGDRENRWAQHIAADPNVRLKVGDAVYEMQAVEVKGKADRDALLQAMVKKYDFTPSPEQRERATLYRLEAR